MPGFDTWEAMSPEQAMGVREDADMVKAMGEAHGWLDLDLLEFNVVRVSQSFIEGHRKCPASAVADVHRPNYGEPAAIGILAHAVADSRVTNQGVDPLQDAVAMQTKLDEMTSAGWAPTSDDFDDRVADYSDALTEVYLERYHQYQPNVTAEISGRITWDVRDQPGAVDFVVMTGTADLLCEREGWRLGVDYKTGARMTEPWMIQRYSTQWRGYAVMFALDEMHFEYPIALRNEDWVAKKYNGIGVVRADAAEREAYRRQLIAEIYPIAESLLRSVNWRDHPIHPTDWHCGAKFCNVFRSGECFGQDRSVAWVDRSFIEAEKLGIKPIPLP